MPQAHDQQYVPQQTAAEILGVTDRTIRTYIADGRLTAYRIRGSRAIRVRRSDVLALLEQVPTVEKSA